jgi:hypothetical protein
MNIKIPTFDDAKAALDFYKDEKQHVCENCLMNELFARFLRGLQKRRAETPTKPKGGMNFGNAWQGIDDDEIRVQLERLITAL